MDDVALRWTAPATGMYLFTTSRPGTEVSDTVLSVLDGPVLDRPVLDRDDDIRGPRSARSRA